MQAYKGRLVKYQPSEIKDNTPFFYKGVPVNVGYDADHGRQLVKTDLVYIFSKEMKTWPAFKPVFHGLKGFAPGREGIFYLRSQISVKPLISPTAGPTICPSEDVPILKSMSTTNNTIQPLGHITTYHNSRRQIMTPQEDPILLYEVSGSMQPGQGCWW